MKVLRCKSHLLKAFVFGFAFLAATLVFSNKVYAGCQSYCEAQRPGGNYGDDCFNTLLDCNSCQFCAGRSVGYNRSESSVIKHQQQLLEYTQNSSLNLDSWTGSSDLFSSESGSSGFFGTVANSLATSLTGPLIDQDGNPLAVLSKDKSKGAISGMASLVSTLYTNPPASSVEYFADLGRNFGFTKAAYAQGYGFKGLEPILPIWKSFRDISYVFFILVFIVTGLAIMLRVKLDPKTVITIQNSIPRIVIALILVTFSYAIAGLLIDLMYVITGLAVTIIDPSGAFEQILIKLKGLPAGVGDTLTGGYPENLNGLMFGFYYLGKGAGFANTISMIFNPITLIANLISGVPDWAIRALQAVLSGNSMGSSGTVVLIVLSAILLFNFFKIFLSLLISYVTILVSIIFGPFQIMLNAIPGQNSFGGWIKNIVANLAVFPTVIIMITLASKIVEAAGQGTLWVAPIVRPPIAQGAPGEIVAAIVGYGMLLLVPKAADMVKAAFKMGKPVAYGTALGEAFGPIRSAGKAGYKAGASEVIGTLEERDRRFLSGALSAVTGVRGRPIDRKRLDQNT